MSWDSRSFTRVSEGGREAIAQQLAGDVLAATYASDFRRELASACRGLTGADYGDDAEDLARDACA